MNTNISKILLALMPLLAAAATLPAQAAADAAGTTAAAATAPAESPMTDGEIRKVDTAAGKLTIKHGPIVNLDMGAMTMIFRVQDPAMLAKVKEGDRVKFSVARINGALTVTALVEPPPVQ
ncbi:copper-binding protein [Cupriavidus basilensis]|uniref:Copper-binding protein n=1 Tax=Cupriavidus basilensis TaxID=68895 RepID=A0ABT6AWI4_9BURK|nr:copper-binding protein [Cupriavidus basilensis]MDF3836987.1 copper-binding protein [Cupriavidus basilensis]